MKPLSKFDSTRQDTKTLRSIIPTMSNSEIFSADVKRDTDRRIEAVQANHKAATALTERRIKSGFLEVKHG